jgi:hypothetical protein
MILTTGTGRPPAHLNVKTCCDDPATVVDSARLKKEFCPCFSRRLVTRTRMLFVPNFFSEIRFDACHALTLI